MKDLLKLLRLVTPWDASAAVSGHPDDPDALDALCDNVSSARLSSCRNLNNLALRIDIPS